MNSVDDDQNSKSSLLLGIGFLLHFLSLMMSAVAFFAPFWMIEINSGYKTGLWGRCDRDEMNCIWFHERDYAWEKHIPGWHKAAQVLYAIGFGVLILSFLTSVGYFIFHCCKTKFSLPFYVGISIGITTLFELLSIIVFGSGAYAVYDVSIHSWLGNFIWAFYVGIATLFVDTASSVFYIMGGRKYMKDMDMYKPSYA